MTRPSRLSDAPRGTKILCGDALARLAELPAGSVQCCVTSPPYFGLRDYGQDGQIGLESTPDEYVARLVAVFAEVKRVLRDDGTLWLNLGDSYAVNRTYQVPQSRNPNHDFKDSNATVVPAGMKAKDLMGVPWMVAFALRADGWYLRSEIIWSKPNVMPESVTDRPTKAHEQVFLLSKSARYYYDGAAIAEASTTDGPMRWGSNAKYEGDASMKGRALARATRQPGDTRNKRSVWTVATQPYPEAHFATFPPKLIAPMILAGCPRGGIVLDPFAGSGTTLQVALANGRSAIGIELNPEYVGLIERRLCGVTPSMFDAGAACA